MPLSEDIVAERYTRRWGTARVHLDELDYESNTPDHTLMLKNVQRLYHIFEVGGCDRFEPDNFVPVLVSADLLARSLSLSSTDEQELKDPRILPHLRIDGGAKLRVLHGIHRLKAAQIFLPAEDRWWTVEIFHEELSESLIDCIKHQYRNEQGVSDGDLYRYLRQAQLAGNDVEAGRWLSRLSKAKQRDVALLHKNESGLTAALTSLLPFPGLWNAVQLGTLRRILGLQCSPEMIRYIHNVRRIWTHIMLDDQDLAGLLDSFTVSQIETLHPTLSNSDKARLHDMMHKRRIFSYIVDGTVRDRIFDRLMKLDEPILSLHTFFEDTKLLEVATQPLKRLLSHRCRGALVDEFRSLHHSPSMVGRTPIQTSDDQKQLSFHTFSLDVAQSYYLCYLQLVLYCIRYFYALTDFAPRREKGQKQFRCPDENGAVAFANLARLAKQLGFSSTLVEEMAQVRPEESASVAFISELRPVDRSENSVLARSELVHDIASRLRDIPWASVARDRPTYTTNLVELEKSHRMGRPFTHSYRFDRPFTFLDVFYGDHQAQTAEYLTSLATRKYIFISFYGNLKLTSCVIANPFSQDEEDDVVSHRRPNAEEDKRMDSRALDQYDMPVEPRNDDNDGLFVGTDDSFSQTRRPASSIYSTSAAEDSASDQSTTESLDEERRRDFAETRTDEDTINHGNTEDIPTQDVLPGHSMIAIEGSLATFAAHEFSDRSPSYITVIHCNTAQYTRAKSEQLASLVVAAANEGLAFATMSTNSDVERQDVKRVRGAAIRDRVVFLYEKRRDNVYAYHELGKFLEQFN